MDYSLVKIPGNEYYSLDFSGGDINVKDRKLEIQQRVLLNVSIFRGENFIVPTSGIDYKNNVFPFNAEDITLQDAFKEAILETAGVVSLNEFTVTQENESLSIKANINTEEGEIGIDIGNLI